MPHALIIPALGMIAQAVMGNVQQKHQLRDNENQQTAANQAATANDNQAHQRLADFNAANPTPNFSSQPAPVPVQKTAATSSKPMDYAGSAAMSDPNSPTMQILKAAGKNVTPSHAPQASPTPGMPSTLSPEILAALSAPKSGGMA